jgi:hypothetical protein
MIPNTKETIRRIRKSSASKVPDAASVETESSSSSSSSSSSTAFTSSKFRDMYTPSYISMLNYRIGETNQPEYSYTYPFESLLSSPEKFDASAFHSKPCIIHVCVYRICKGSHTFPYLQFKLKLDSKKRQLVFPSFSFQFKDSADSNGCVKHANEHIAQWFKGSGLDGIEFKGIYHHRNNDDTEPEIETSGGARKYNRNKRKQQPVDKSDQSDSDLDLDSDSESDSDSYTSLVSSDDQENKSNESCNSLYLVYEDAVCEKEEDGAVLYASSKSEWWWACVHEVFNTRRILFHRVGRNVTSLFECEPGALFLMNDAGDVYETPHILYKGLPAHVALDEMIAFGPRKCVDDNNVSSSRDRVHAAKNINEILMHGSHYYFYEFCDALRGACYTYDDAANTYKKIQSRPSYLFRYVVFLGKIKTIVFDTAGTTNHDRINRAHMFRERLWPSTGYNSIYHGKYKVLAPAPASGGGKKRGEGTLLYPAFSVADVHRFIGASYHEVDASTVPDDINSILKLKKLVKIK